MERVLQANHNSIEGDSRFSSLCSGVKDALATGHGAVKGINALLSDYSPAEIRKVMDSSWFMACSFTSKLLMDSGIILDYVELVPTGAVTATTKHIFGEATQMERLEIIHSLRKCRIQGITNFSEEREKNLWTTLGMGCLDDVDLVRKWLRCTLEYNNELDFIDTIAQMFVATGNSTLRRALALCMVSCRGSLHSLGKARRVSVSQLIKNMARKPNQWPAYLVRLSIKIWEPISLERLLEDLLKCKRARECAVAAFREYGSETEPNLLISSLRKMKPDAMRGFVCLIRLMGQEMASTKERILRVSKTQSPLIYKMLNHLIPPSESSIDEIQSDDSHSSSNTSIAPSSKNWLITEDYRELITKLKKDDPKIDTSSVYSLLMTVVIDLPHVCSEKASEIISIIRKTLNFARSTEYPIDKVVTGLQTIIQQFEKPSEKETRSLEAKANLRRASYVYLALINYSETAFCTCNLDVLTYVLEHDLDDLVFDHWFTQLDNLSPHFIAMKCYIDKQKSQLWPLSSSYSNEEWIICFMHLIRLSVYKATHKSFSRALCALIALIQENEQADIPYLLMKVSCKLWDEELQLRSEFVIPESTQMSLDSVVNLAILYLRKSLKNVTNAMDKTYQQLVDDVIPKFTTKRRRVPQG